MKLQVDPDLNGRQMLQELRAAKFILKASQRFSMAFASDQRRLQSKFVTKMFTRNYSFAASFAFCDRQLRAWALLPGYEVWSVESEKRPSKAQKENQKNVKKREEHMKGSKCFTRADHFGLSMDEWKKRKDPPKKKRAGPFDLSTEGGCFMGFTWPPLWGVLLRATPFKPRIFGSGCSRSVFSSSQEALVFCLQIAQGGRRSATRQSRI
jgi:hypothetical protein